MTGAEAPLRSFVAVALPDAVRASIAEAAGALARELPGVRWSRKPENLHVTMKFLGPVEPARLDVLGAALGDALAGVPRFGFTVRGWGAFPSARDAKVIFAGLSTLDDARGLAQLNEVAEVVDAVAARFGFPREARRFTGHVTVGRSKEGVDARAALARDADRAFGTVEVSEVHVYESRLSTASGEGSTYVLRGRAALGAN